MKFEDQRNIDIRLGCILITEKSQYLVFKKLDNYSLLNIETVESLHFEVSLEHIEEMITEDLKENIQSVIPPENIKIVAQNKI
ncbi:hypothetical protein [Lysinibacillus xylanilyticus]|uniref:hypothetical protein n=1 Tax=Lysinibacillus xylanilyticus TaxID=582475 RepID=UPI002B2527E8|nr:hypothetical protein [Lysinibacillus xylanilyticus]MEB2299432.1 hypothetical protein [Lysinibacillus xylanilyticus]